MIDLNNNIFNETYYIEFFKKITKKKKKHSSIYTLWIDYLISNNIDIQEFSKLRNININELNKKCKPNININDINLINYKKLNKNNLLSYIFKEEYNNIVNTKKKSLNVSSTAFVDEHIDNHTNKYVTQMIEGNDLTNLNIQMNHVDKSNYDNIKNCKDNISQLCNLYEMEKNHHLNRTHMSYEKFNLKDDTHHSDDKKHSTDRSSKVLSKQLECFCLFFSFNLFFL